MNEIAVNGGRRMTLKEVAETTGTSYRTVAKYAQKAGWTKNGKQTLLDEGQVTIILEAMKQSIGQGGKRAAVGKERLALAMQGIDTSQASLEGLRTSQRRMTVREVAGVLGVSPDTIKNSIRERFPDLMQNGKTTYLNEAEVTALKLNLRKNSQVATQPKTDLEKALLIQQAMQFQQEIIADLEGKNRDLQAANESLSQEKETLEIALNDSLQFYTVAKYNSAFKMGWTMRQCQVIGKRLTAHCGARAIKEKTEEGMNRQ